MGCSSSIPQPIPDPCEVCPDRYASPDGKPVKPKPARHFCLHCENPLCDSCKDDHQRNIKASRPHHIVSYDEYKSGRWHEFIQDRRQKRCSKHLTEDVVHFCVNHKVSLCHDCVSESHSGCETGEVEVLRRKWKGEIDRLMRKVEKSERHMSGKHRELERRHQDMELLEKHLHDEIDLRYDTVVEALENIREQRKKEVTEASEEKDREIVELSGECQTIASVAATVRKENNHKISSANRSEQLLKVMLDVKEDLNHRSKTMETVSSERMQKALADIKFSPVEMDDLEMVGSVFGQVTEEENSRGLTANLASRGSIASTRSFTSWSDNQSEAGYSTAGSVRRRSRAPPRKSVAEPPNVMHIQEEDEMDY